MVRVLKNILLNLGFLALLVAVMLPAGFAEGQLGHCSFEASAFQLSIALTILSGLAYGMVGKRSSLAMRCVAVVVVLWFVLSQVLYLLFEKPDLVRDIAQYWVGAVISVCLVVVQGFCNRRNFALLSSGRSSQPG